MSNVTTTATKPQTQILLDRELALEYVLSQDGMMHSHGDCAFMDEIEKCQRCQIEQRFLAAVKKALNV